jgi:predicted metal-dependent HD superfamily phosphohydrolase
METLHNNWQTLCNHYTTDHALIEKCYAELTKAYTEKQRHYHTLEHIASMMTEILVCKDPLLNKDALLFATWFHDIVYDPKKHDNEQRSAAKAVERLNQLQVPKEMILLIEQLILATANHVTAAFTPELNFFLDCDLKILGAASDKYQEYATAIRKEYKHVLSFIYKLERKKVLQRFIASPVIYRTVHFQERYEQQARINVANEIENK